MTSTGTPITPMTHLQIRLRSADKSPAEADGCRILVDRLWPKGKSKDSLHLDAWLKDVAPSTALCRWFSYDPAKWTEFQRRYREELAADPAALDLLRYLATLGPVTLVYSARDEQHNNAVVLKDVIDNQLW